MYLSGRKMGRSHFHYPDVLHLFDLSYDGVPYSILFILRFLDEYQKLYMALQEESGSLFINNKYLSGTSRPVFSALF